jgi:hypothetical protein
MTMMLIMLISDGSTTCHVMRHLAHTSAPVAPVAIPGIPVVVKPPIVLVGTIPLMLAITTIHVVGVVPQIHVVSNTAAAPYDGCSTHRHAKSDTAVNACRCAKGWWLAADALRVARA